MQIARDPTHVFFPTKYDSINLADEQMNSRGWTISWED